MSTVWRSQIHAGIEFDRPLDLDRLTRAFRLCADADPVLGCRWVRRWWRARWDRLDESELDKADWLREISPGGEDVFLGDEMHAERGPQVRAIIYPKDGGHRLVVKINHMVVDAGGTKEFLYRLAGMYAHLEKNPHFKPAPNLADRGMGQLYRGMGFATYLRLLARHGRETRQNMRPYASIRVPVGEQISGAPVFRFRRFDPPRVQEMRRYAAEYGATLNDLLVTAKLRALAAQCGWTPDTGSALRMIGTVDLRRYLPGKTAQALCNLSGFLYSNLGTELEADFGQTLRRVKAGHDAQKDELFGLAVQFASVAMLWPYPLVFQRWLSQAIFRHLARSGNMMPGMTNLGPIRSEELDFGPAAVTAAEVIVPAAVPPNMFTGVSGFRDTLTISAGFYESAVSAGFFEKLLDAIDAELSFR